jgi:hypothetical protein
VLAVSLDLIMIHSQLCKYIWISDQCCHQCET